MTEYTTTKAWRWLKHVPLLNAAGDKVMVLFVAILAKRSGMALFPQEHTGTKFRYLIGWYEHDSVLVCREILHPGMNALDIGADIGYYARLFSGCVGPKGQVWAFEPDPKSFGLLEENTKGERWNNIRLVRKAVSDREGDEAFFVMNLPAKHGFYEASQINTELSTAQEITVETTTIDDFLAQQGNPDIHLIKMDIEGAELRALKGAAKTISRMANLALLIEFNIGTLKLAGVDPKEFLEEIEKMGLHLKAIVPGVGLCEVDEKVFRLAEEGYVNLLCIKGKVFDSRT